jgi:hypothetical protein
MPFKRECKFERNLGQMLLSLFLVRILIEDIISAMDLNSWFLGFYMLYPELDLSENIQYSPVLTVQGTYYGCHLLMRLLLFYLVKIVVSKYFTTKIPNFVQKTRF